VHRHFVHLVVESHPVYDRHHCLEGSSRQDGSRTKQGQRERLSRDDWVSLYAGRWALSGVGVDDQTQPVLHAGLLRDHNFDFDARRSVPHSASHPHLQVRLSQLHEHLLHVQELSRLPPPSISPRRHSNRPTSPTVRALPIFRSGPGRQGHADVEQDAVARQKARDPEHKLRIL